MIRSATASFLGSHVNKIDQKGRVAAPADFRRALEPEKGFFSVPAIEGPFLECGGEDYVLRQKAMINALPPYHEDRLALEDHLIGAMRPLFFDAEGRIVLPEALRSHARLQDRVLFVGLGDTFVIRAAEGEEERLAASRERARAALRRLNNPGAAQ
jgi:MraZ protein